MSQAAQNLELLRGATDYFHGSVSTSNLSRGPLEPSFPVFLVGALLDYDLLPEGSLHLVYVDPVTLVRNVGPSLDPSPSLTMT